MSKPSISYIKPLLIELFNNEPSWEVIKNKINESFAEKGIKYNGQIYQLTTTNDAKVIFNMAGLDLKKRPRFNGRKEKVDSFFTFEEEEVNTEVSPTESLVSAW